MAPVRTEAERSWVPTTFLSINSRPVFLPVPVWADRLFHQLVTLRAEPIAVPGSLSECFNQSALLQTIVGDLEAARSICLAQIEWAVRLSRRSRDEGLLAYALQPWVNLGRLYVRDQQPVRSLEHFSLAVSYEQRRAVELGPCTITSTGWDAIARVGGDEWSRSSARSLSRYLWTTFVVDSYRAYATMRDFRSAEDLLLAQRRSAPAEVDNLIDEAAVLRLLAEDSFAEAAATCDQAKPGTVQETFAYLEYQMACDVGRHALEDASGLGLTLGVLCRSGAFADIPVVGRIGLLTQLGRMHEAIGDEISAATAYQSGFEVANSSSDERSMISLSELLAKCAGSDAAHWQEVHAAAANGSWYVLAGERTGETRPDVVRQLYTQVIEYLMDR